MALSLSTARPARPTPARSSDPSEAELDAVHAEIRRKRLTIGGLEAEIKILEQQKQLVWARVMRARANQSHSESFS
jgi:phage shock protein A